MVVLGITGDSTSTSFCCSVDTVSSSSETIITSWTKVLRTGTERQGTYLLLKLLFSLLCSNDIKTQIFVIKFPW